MLVWLGSFAGINIVFKYQTSNPSFIPVPSVKYQLPTKLLLPSYSYLRYLCYMHIFLRL